MNSGVLADLALALTAVPVDLDDVLDGAALAMRELVGDAGVVRLTDDAFAGEQAVLLAVSCADPATATVVRQLAAAGEGKNTAASRARLDRSGRPLVVDPVTDERLVGLEAEFGMGLRPQCASLRLHALLAVPLMSDHRLLGYLLAFRDRPGIGYTEDDTATAVDIAARVSSVLAAARSVNLLRTSEERYRRIVETTAEGIWEFDCAGRTRFVNEQMARMLDLDRDEVVGRLPGEFLNEQDAIALVPPGGVVTPLAGQQYDLTLIREDGTRLCVHATTTPMLDGNDQRIGSLAMLTDVTDRVRAQDLERQLDQMRRLDSLGQLAGGIAHDFNNLLVVIGGFAQVVADQLPAGSPLVPYLHHIGTAAAKGDALTRQLLAFGRGGGGGREVVDVQQLLDELEPLLRRTLGEHVELVVTTGGSDPIRAVRSNRGQLEQVIVNLAANARDAMRGGGTLTIQCENATLDVLDPDEVLPSTEGHFVRIAVSDTGHGMAPEVQRRAFEPFFTTKEVGKGTGLGLASVYGIVRGLRGKILLYSEVNVGTTVKIFLPSTEEAPLPAVEPQAPPTLRLGRVLVVEDQVDVGHLVDVMLEPAGADVTVVDGPAEALALLDRGLEIDLLITDVIMPDMTGPELVPRIHQRCPGLPVLYMSGYTAGVLGDRGQVEPGAELLEKPFTRNRLLNAIGTVLDRAGVSR